MVFPSCTSRSIRFDYQGYLSFYKQLAVNIHAAGMKMVVETGVVFPGMYAGRSITTPRSRTAMYVAGRAQQILTIAREIQPDYLVIAEEPDTEAEITGKPFIAHAFGLLLDGGYVPRRNSTPRDSPATNVGAGVGTWL